MKAKQEKMIIIMSVVGDTAELKAAARTKWLTGTGNYE